MSLLEIETYSIDVVNSTFIPINTILDFQDLEFTTRLNGVGDAEFSLNVDSANANPSELARYRTHILIKIDGITVPAVYYLSDFTGEYEGIEGQVRLLFLDHSAHLNAILTEEFRNFSNLDAGTIADTLVAEAQAKPNGQLNINTGTITTVGTTNDTLEYQEILQAIQNQSDNIISYNFEFVPVLNGDNKLDSLNFNVYKSLGSLRNDLDPLTLDTIDSIEFSSTDEVYNSIIVQGAGTGDEVITVSAGNEDSQKTLTRREKFFKKSELKSEDSLQSFADSYLIRSAVPQKTFNVAVKSTVYPYGTIQLGDILNVNIVKENTFINFVGTARVIEITVKVDNNGKVSIIPRLQFSN